MRTTVISLVLLLAASFGSAQQDFSKVEIESTKVAGNVWMLTGAGGNMGASIGEDGIILIDDQYAPLAPRIKEELARLSDSEVLYVLNTHWHGDHTGGNEAFGDVATLVAHHNVRKRLAEGMEKRSTPPAADGALPVLTFGKDLTLHYNGEEIRLIHLPHGHTDGDSVVWFPQSNVIHMGDLYFQGRFPYIDLDSGGSVRGVIRNLELVLDMIPGNSHVIPGHGKLSNVAELREYLGMIEATVARVSAAINDGKTLEQMKDERILAEWEENSWSFIPTDRYLEILHTDLSRPEADRHEHGGLRHSHKN